MRKLYDLMTEMSFVGGKACFIAKARQGMCYPLGSEKRVVIDGELVGGGGGIAYFENHRWSTEQPEAAAGMVKQPHFMDNEGYWLDPACLPPEALKIWGSLNRKEKQRLALDLIGGTPPAEAVLPFIDAAAHRATAEVPVAVAEPIECPAGCGVKVDNEVDPLVARTAMLTHVRLMHPDWQA